MKVYLTAGHQVINGKGTGAHSEYGDEAIEALRVRDALTYELTTRGVQVVNDAPSDPLSKVIDWLKNSVREKDIAIDIHFNSAASGAANGTEVVIPEAWSKTEQALASDLANVISSALGTKLRKGAMIYAGVKTERETFHKKIGVLRTPFRAHNALIEIGFLSNVDDMGRYRGHFKALIKNLADVICKYAA